MPINNPHEHDARIQFWNKMYRTALLTLVIVGVSTVVFVAVLLLDQSKDIKAIIVNNNKATIEARKANKARQDATIQHVDCIVLLGKKYPEINFQALTYDEASAYLNKCAVKE